MSNINFDMFLEESCKQSDVGDILSLVGFKIHNSPDQICAFLHSREDFFNCYAQVQYSDSETYRAFCIQEFFNFAKAPTKTVDRYDLKILATLPEAEVLFDSDINESIGMYIGLTEGEPDNVEVIFIDPQKLKQSIKFMMYHSPN